MDTQITNGTQEPDRLEMDQVDVDVLFMDIIRYSLLPPETQALRMREMQAVVKKTSAYQAAETSGALIKLPRGDGLALVFIDDHEGPIRCAVEIGRYCHNHEHLKLRIGIERGKVHLVKDINGLWDVAGNAINLASRVMTPGDEGHILLSKEVGEYVKQNLHDIPLPHDLGECKIKHGGIVYLYNLFSKDYGNPNFPEGVMRKRMEDKVLVIGRNQEDAPWIAGLRRSLAYWIVLFILLWCAWQSQAVREVVCETFHLQINEEGKVVKSPDPAVMPMPAQSAPAVTPKPAAAPTTDSDTEEPKQAKAHRSHRSTVVKKEQDDSQSADQETNPPDRTEPAEPTAGDGEPGNTDVGGDKTPNTNDN